MTKRISEEDADFKSVREEWARRAKACHTTDDLKTFVDELLANEYDYGAIVHACFAAAMAAFNVIEHSPQGGITGFQASCLMWMFIRQFGSHLPDAILHLRDWSRALYPQYESEFSHTVHHKTMGRLVELAKAKLAEAHSDPESLVHPDILSHWTLIAKGKAPFGLTVFGHETTT
jgi:hypothetical protein